MARLGPFGIAAYIAVKAGADLRNGQAEVSARTIADQTGMSEKAARGALKKLEAEGLVNASWQRGCNKVYQLIERLPILDSDGEQVGVAAWQFTALNWKEQLEGVVGAAARELARNIPTSAAPSSTTVNIGNVNVNVLVVAPSRGEAQP